MGKFTALNDSLVDRTIETHLQRIVAAITSRLEPHSIVLRGSFGRGEGSVMLENDELHFLSDYEIDVATFSPFYRSVFAELTHDLSIEFGMQTGIRWIRPDCLTRGRIGPFPTGKAPITISIYEFRYGSMILYGKDFISSGPAINSDQILVESGIQLLLNRMAESLCYMTLNDQYVDDSFVTYHWINKTILACAESLLLLWKQYHYSYQERGRRFGLLAREHLVFMGEQRTGLSNLVTQATEFKLRPRNNIYCNTVHETWLQLIPICAAVFRYLIEQGIQIAFSDYTEFPKQFLHHSSQGSSLGSRTPFLALKSYELYRAVRAHCGPRSLLSPFQASQIVYAVVPLLFMSYRNRKQGELLDVARHWLAFLGPLRPASSDVATEWDYLRQQVTTYWKIFCY